MGERDVVICHIHQWNIDCGSWLQAQLMHHIDCFLPDALTDVADGYIFSAVADWQQKIIVLLAGVQGVKGLYLFGVQFAEVEVKIQEIEVTCPDLRLFMDSVLFPGDVIPSIDMSLDGDSVRFILKDVTGYRFARRQMLPALLREYSA